MSIPVSWPTGWSDAELKPFGNVTPKPAVTGANQRWSMDFVSVALADGRHIRSFTVVDDPTRECLVIEVERSLPAERVNAALDRVARMRGHPRSVCTTDQCSGARRWISGRTNTTSPWFIEPDRPVQDAFTESFSSHFRDERLNEHWFLDLAHAQATIETWRRDYNAVRPHGQLGGRTPDEYVVYLQERLEAVHSRSTND